MISAGARWCFVALGSFFLSLRAVARRGVVIDFWGVSCHVVVCLRRLGFYKDVCLDESVQPVVHGNIRCVVGPLD